MSKLATTCFFYFLWISFCPLFGQQDFTSFYEKTDPARNIDNPTEKKLLHENFLADAIANQDTLKIILGNLYLSTDLDIASDYTAAIDYLINAHQLAAAQKDTLLLGRINHKKGAVYLALENNTKSIEFYEAALLQNKIAKDTQYIAISMEQLARLFARISDYEQSNAYYQEAIPMIKQFCPPRSLSTCLINYGNTLDEQDSVAKAIQMYHQAIAIGEALQDDYEIFPAKQNLALVYVKSDSLNQALELYYECKEAHIKNGWLDYLIYTYGGLSWTFEKMDNMDSAFFYFQEYHYLKDSIIGAKVQNQVNQLEKNAQLLEKDIEILKQKETAYQAQQKLYKTIIGALTLLSLLIWVAWYFYHRARKAKLRLEENRKALKDLAALLEVKNAELRDKNNQLQKQATSNPTQDQTPLLTDINYYEMVILTETDWQTFKGLFERTYPNYLQKIRQQFPDITPAEERLFIFIKLQISTKEAANILGVLPDTVRKTRTRLRKRLGLEEKESLNDFVQNFK